MTRLLNAGSASLKRGSLLHVKGTEIDVVMAISLLTESPKMPLKDQRKFKQPGEVLMVMR